MLSFHILVVLVSERVKQQIEDNSKWIQEAGKHNLVSPDI